MGVGLAAAADSTRVGFAVRVHVRMLLAIGTIGETTITARIVALEWPLAYNTP